MNRHFLIMSVDPELSVQCKGRERIKKGSALELAKSRLDKGFWPLYVRTRDSGHISTGDRLAFYIGGTKRLSKQIIASACVENIEKWNLGSKYYDEEIYCTDLPEKILKLRKIEYLESPVSFRTILPKLSICPTNLRFWGIVLQGGVRKLDQNDRDIIFARQE